MSLPSILIRKQGRAFWLDPADTPCVPGTTAPEIPPLHNAERSRAAPSPTYTNGRPD